MGSSCWSCSTTSHPTVITVKGTLRLANQPSTNRKKPLDVNHLKLLAGDSNLEVFATEKFGYVYSCIFCFFFFFRSSELCTIHSKDVQFNEGFIAISIKKSTTDQLREGDMLLSLSLVLMCPCTLLKLHIKAQIAYNSDDYLLRLNFPHQVTISILFLLISLSAIQLIDSLLRILLRALCLIALRACSHGSGGPQEGDVPRLGGVTNLSIQFLIFLSHPHVN